MSYNDATIEGAPAPSFIVGAAQEAERIRALVADVERLSERALRNEREAYDSRMMLTNFKQYVAKATATYDHGCRAGKREFLETIGLEMPPRTFNVTAHISFEVTLDEDDVDGSTFTEFLDDACRMDINIDFIDYDEADDG